MFAPYLFAYGSLDLCDVIRGRAIALYEARHGANYPRRTPPQHKFAMRFQIAKDPVERSRWRFLWFLARGFTAKGIASITEYSAYWIGQITRRYNVRGL